MSTGRPQRIQRKRTAGYRHPAGTVFVTRPGPLGNPWLIVADDSGERHGWWIHHEDADPRHFGGHNFGVFARTMADARDISVTAYALTTVRDLPPDLLERVRNARFVACFCDPDDGMACHGDVLIDAACGTER